jgi:IclR family acetate operon transcriptional repressor
MDSQSGRTLKTTQTSLDIINAIHQLDGATIADLEDELNLSKSTVHGHVSTLAKNHYLVKENGEYHLSLAFFNHGEHTRTRRESYRLVRNKVSSLAGEINEEVDFSVEEHGRTIVLFDEIGDVNKRGFQVGQYFHMNTNAAGKAILAELPEERVGQIIDYWGLPADTEKTITDRAELYEALDRTRERGYARNNGENYPGIHAIGSTVHNPDGSILGALAISGPQYRLQDNEELVEPLFDAIADLEDQIETSLY